MSYVVRNTHSVVQQPVNKTSGVTGKDATRNMARHVASLKYEALPEPLVDLMKQCVLDTLGVILGASGMAPEGRIAYEYVKSMEGKPESTLLGYGGKAPAAWATFVNGGLGHMLDYDDTGGGHCSIATIPGAFALAERKGGISGRDLITAVAAGTDVITRLDVSIPIPEWTAAEGWFATQLFGFISAAATGGHVLGLNDEQMENAMGIGFNQLSGTRQMAAGASTHMRSMQAGFSGQGGTMAALLAERGMIGDKDFLEGKYGLFKTYVRTNDPDWDALVGDLGTRFPLLQTHGFKVWPACGYTRATNTATLKLRRDHKLTPEDVEHITIIGGHSNTQQLSEPVEKKRRPKIAIDGKFSIPFTTAVMMAKGNVTLRDYTEEGLNDPAVLAMADRVSYRPVAANEERTQFPEVEIKTRDGRVLRHKADSVPGDAKNPVDWDMLETKFRDCISFSAKPVSKANADRVIAMVRDLENLKDATEIIRLLS
jgi:2-methylcitrate dehydratase PrpD